MFPIINARTIRWALPCCSLLLLLYIGYEWRKPEPLTPLDFVYPYDNQVSYQEKAEKLLADKAALTLTAFGESGTAIVTVEVNGESMDTETFLPLKEGKVLESIQIIGESMDGESDYRHSKSAENYTVGHRKTVSKASGLRIGKMSCLVSVSPDSAGRVQEIERAVAIALGMNFERGDAVMVVVE